MRIGARLLAALCAGAFCAISLGACGDTLQDRPIPHNTLESMIVAPFPVYWLGGVFRGLAITNATHDPGGAYSIQYGDCVKGGQSTCVPRLRVVTSPDNSFLPAGSTPRVVVKLRGLAATVAQRGTTIQFPTAGVVVGIYGNDSRLSGAAARTVVPINFPGAPEAPLPAPSGDTGFAETPLPGQLPPQLQRVR